MVKIRYCGHCLSPFVIGRSDKKFCCAAHRVASHRGDMPIIESITDRLKSGKYQTVYAYQVEALLQSGMPIEYFSFWDESWQKLDSIYTDAEFVEPDIAVENYASVVFIFQTIFEDSEKFYGNNILQIRYCPELLS